MSSPLSIIYEFGRFRLDRGNQRLTRDGMLVPTPGKTLPILIDLIVKRDQIVSTETLADEHFPRAEYGEEELTAEILKIKRILEDNSKVAPIIRYLFGKGYQFEAEVTEYLGDASDGSGFRDSNDPAPVPVAPPAAKSNSVLKAVGIATAIIIAAVLGGGVWRYFAASSVGASSDGVYSGPPRIAVLPFQSLSGQAHDDSFNKALYSDLYDELSKQPDMHLVPMEEMQRYVESGATDPVTAGHQMTAHFIVHTVAGQLVGKTLVKVQLLNTRDGSQVWISSFEASSGDSKALAGQIAQKVSSAVAANAESQ